MDRIAIAGALVIFICTLFMAYLWLFRKPICEEAAAKADDGPLATCKYCGRVSTGGKYHEQQCNAPPRIHNAAIEATAEAVQEYAVSGKTKRVPFRERKKELREKARTKRQKMEEWREDE